MEDLTPASNNLNFVDDFFTPLRLSPLNRPWLIRISDIYSNIPIYKGEGANARVIVGRAKNTLLCIYIHIYMCFSLSVSLS